jgi:hypothetical protein
MRVLRLPLFAVVTVVLVWLMRAGQPVAPLYSIVEVAPVAELGTAFDPARCGSLVCEVHWEGELPADEPIPVHQAKLRPKGKREMPNPNAPRISPDLKVAHAVILLRGIDPARSRPWGHPPVTVECATDLRVRQGDRTGTIGFARRGAPVEFVSREAANHSVRVRGAAFFTQMLFTPDRPVSRPMPDEGIVELSSGGGYYWVRAYLAVSEHPYLGLTDGRGSVRFDEVPDGEYDAVCWKANWHIAECGRDPEWIAQSDLRFHPPAEYRQRVTISAGQLTDVKFTLRESDFAPGSR